MLVHSGESSRWNGDFPIEGDEFPEGHIIITQEYSPVRQRLPVDPDRRTIDILIISSQYGEGEGFIDFLILFVVGYPTVDRIIRRIDARIDVSDCECAVLERLDRIDSVEIMEIQDDISCLANRFPENLIVIPGIGLLGKKHVDTDHERTVLLQTIDYFRIVRSFEILPFSESSLLDVSQSGIVDLDDHDIPVDSAARGCVLREELIGHEKIHLRERKRGDPVEKNHKDDTYRGDQNRHGDFFRDEETPASHIIGSDSEYSVEGRPEPHSPCP